MAVKTRTILLLLLLWHTVSSIEDGHSQREKKRKPRVKEKRCDVGDRSGESVNGRLDSVGNREKKKKREDGEKIPPIGLKWWIQLPCWIGRDASGLRSLFLPPLSTTRIGKVTPRWLNSTEKASDISVSFWLFLHYTLGNNTVDSPAWSFYFWTKKIRTCLSSRERNPTVGPCVKP